MDRSDINRLLLDVCRERGATQADLVRATSATSPTVSDWFNKGAVPDAATLAQLARFLRVNGHWLLTGQGPKSPPGQGESKGDASFALGADAVLSDVRSLLEEFRGKLEARWPVSQRGAHSARAAAFVRQQADLAGRTPGRRKRVRRKAG